MTAATPAQAQPQHDADDLVTAEMVETAVTSYYADDSILVPEMMRAALRAVAPMIAAQPFRNADEKDWAHLFAFIPESGHGKFWKAVLMEAHAAAIRARGETT
jgi:hypothetical protein